MTSTTASRLLRSSRVTTRHGQSILATKAGTTQAEVSFIERGRRIPNVDTLERLLRATGHQLIAAPVDGLTAVQAAAETTVAIANGAEDAAFRIFIAYSDSLAKTDGVGRVLLSAAAPAPTGSPKWDAALAAASEYWLDAAVAPKPRWLNDDARRLSSPTPLLSDPYVPIPDAADVPLPFSSRGLLLDATTLSSV